MSRKVLWQFAITLLLGLSLSAALQASIDRGVIQGTVTDSAGALVPGAKVVVKNVDTNVEVTLVTNAAGFYLAPELVPGRYTVRAESPGFVPLDVTNVVVTAGVTSQQDLTLRVGALTQSIVRAHDIKVVRVTRPSSARGVPKSLRSDHSGDSSAGQ